MSLCLLVYNLGQRELRKTLKSTNSKVKNQLGKLTNTPTLRWIFQCFQVVHFLRINQSPKVVNLTEERSLILEFLPSSCQKYYLGNNNKKRQTSSPLRDRLPVRFANALLEELRKLIDANNRSIVPLVCSAAKRNPWFVQNIHATNFLCSIELICLIC